ncbi:hypothetical protein GALMADRAFT_148640, partial [Galerina marginata CBS 339.88]
MSHDGPFARSIPFTQGETQDIAPPEPGIKYVGQSSSALPTEDSSSSAPHGPDVRGHTTHSSPESLALVKILDSIIDDFRNKQFTKARTIARLTSALGLIPDRDQPEKETAFTQYLASIESIERLAAEASQRGLHASIGLGGQQAEARPVNEHETFIKSLVTDRSTKRGRESNNSSDNEDIVGEDDGPVESSNKKIRLFERDMPWYNRESAARQSANPSCIKTREILIKFAQDYATVKHWITVAHSAPCGFPSVEWENIIKGKPISLDNVLSSLHHISPIKEN